MTIHYHIIAHSLKNYICIIFYSSLKYTSTLHCGTVCCFYLVNFLFFFYFEKLRKSIISFIMYVCPSVHPSVRVEQLGSHWKDFREFVYLSIIRKICRENSCFIETWLEQEVLHIKTNVHFWSYLARFFLK